jgi:hypothetical protein
MNPYMLRTYVSDALAIDTTQYSKQYCFESTKQKLISIFDKYTTDNLSDFKSDQHKAKWRRLLLYAFENLMQKIYADLQVEAGNTDFALHKMIQILKNNDDKEDEPVTGDFQRFLLPTLSDFSVYTGSTENENGSGEKNKYVRMKIYKHGLEFNIFSLEPGKIMVDCKIFQQEGGNSNMPEEKYTAMLQSVLVEIVLHFKNDAQVDALQGDQKKLYQTAKSQDARIEFDYHDCVVDPKTDSGMWCNYVQRMIANNSENDWEHFKKEADNPTKNEMSSFVKSFAIHVLKMSEHKIKNTALTYTSSSGIAIQMKQPFSIQQWNIRLSVPQKANTCEIRYNGFEVPCNCDPKSQ